MKYGPDLTVIWWVGVIKVCKPFDINEGLLSCSLFGMNTIFYNLINYQPYFFVNLIFLSTLFFINLIFYQPYFLSTLFFINPIFINLIFINLIFYHP